MIKEEVVKKFRKLNIGSDVMGVIRTFYPDIEITQSTKKIKKAKKSSVKQ